MATEEHTVEAVAEPSTVVAAPETTEPAVDKAETTEDAIMDESEEAKRLRATRQSM